LHEGIVEVKITTRTILTIFFILSLVFRKEKPALRFSVAGSSGRSVAGVGLGRLVGVDVVCRG
jgi:hypothetical protein